MEKVALVWEQYCLKHFPQLQTVAILLAMAVADCYSDQAFPLRLVKPGSFDH